MKKSKHTLGYWKRKIDPEFSKLVREKGFCEMCGRRDCKFDDAHVVGRRNLTLRWDILNHMCLCFQCHLFKWHEEPLESSKWFQEKYPQRYEYLMKVKNIQIKRTEEDYIELMENIKNRKLDKLIAPKSIIDNI